MPGESTAPRFGPNKFRLRSCSSVLLKALSNVLGAGKALPISLILLRRILGFRRNSSAISKFLVS